MFKLNVGIGCGMAVAAFGRTGESPSDIVRRGTPVTAAEKTDHAMSLMQDMSVSLIAAGSTHKYHEHSAELLEQLENLAAGAKELPASILLFIDAIKNHTDEIKGKLIEEHGVQTIDLNDKFKLFGQCVATLNEALVTVDGDAAHSKKSISALAKSNLCTYRKTQANAKLDSQGCQEELECRKVVVERANTSQNSFVKGPGYVNDGGTSLCGNSAPAPTQRITATEVEELQAWMDREKVASAAHWNAKRSELAALIAAYEAAVEVMDQLRDGTDVYQGKGCLSLHQTLQNANLEAVKLSGTATLSQCSYYDSKDTACNLYAACHDAAAVGWAAAKSRETVNSEDRKKAWVVAGRIKCWASTITENAEGKADIDASGQAACSASTCDAQCITALDLSASLAREAPAASPCTRPSMPCTGWDTSCDTGSWGTYTPLYYVGARTAPQCSVTAVAVNLGEGQVTDACQACN